MRNENNLDLVPREEQEGCVDWRRSRVRDEGPGRHTKMPTRCCSFLNLIEPIIQCRRLVVSALLSITAIGLWRC
jgi:hypothetical protein